jgi:hypothetical protein
MRWTWVARSEPQGAAESATRGPESESASCVENPTETGTGFGVTPPAFPYFIHQSLNPVRTLGQPGSSGRKDCRGLSC